MGIVRDHQSPATKFLHLWMQSQYLLHQMGCRTVKTVVVVLGCTTWHSKQVSILFSTILSMHGNQTFSLIRAFVFTIPKLPSWARSTIRSCKAAGTTIRSDFNSKVSVQVSCSFIFPYRDNSDSETISGALMPNPRFYCRDNSLKCCIFGDRILYLG